MIKVICLLAGFGFITTSMLIKGEVGQFFWVAGILYFIWADIQTIKERQ